MPEGRSLRWLSSGRQRIGQRPGQVGQGSCPTKRGGMDATSASWSSTMTVQTIGRRALWLLAAGLFLPAGARAGVLSNLYHNCKYDCPPGQYSHLHYTTPTVWRLYAHCRMSHLGQPTPQVDSTLPATPIAFDAFRPKCPYVPAAAFYPPPAASTPAASSEPAQKPTAPYRSEK
jgi:hypothetical protein